MEEEPLLEHEPEAPPRPKRFPWLIPVLGLLAVLILWLLTDILFFNRGSVFSCSERDRLCNELTGLRIALEMGKIAPEQAQAKLDALAKKHARVASKRDFDRVQWMIDDKKMARRLPLDSVREHPEWPVILSFPPPESGSHP